jgi:hypothetical protein
MTLACRNAVKEKSPDASVVVDVWASGPSTIDTVAAGIGTNVWLVTTVPLSVYVLGGDGAAGDGVTVGESEVPPPQAIAETTNNAKHSRFNI